MAIQSINPANEEVLQSFDEYTEVQVDEKLELAMSAFRDWREVSFARRAELVRAAAKQLRDGAEALVGLITDEMGKPLAQAKAEVEKCAWCCDYFADNAERFLANLDTPSSATKSYVAFDPIGPVLAIMPWNFPFWQVFRFAAPALMAGNVGILKHASNVPQCALAIERVFQRAGIPGGVFQTLLIGGERATKLIADPRIAAVTLTGSEEAGSKVAEAAGRALKKTVLELGGSDPYIVLPGADIDEAARIAVDARFQNAGQSCIAAKRFIVVDRAATEFEERFAARIRDIAVGDPRDEATKVGPLAKADLVDTLDEQVRSSVSQGAKVSVGGHALEGTGYFYAPTLLTDVTPEMEVFTEETFGPAAALIRADDAEHAIALANRSRFGLGANLWTGDLEKAERYARQIESGSVFINGMVASDPRLPFGGVKQSGYGRELSDFGIREFVNIKTVWIGPAQTQAPPKSE